MFASVFVAQGFARGASAQSQSPWAATTPYPSAVFGESCAAYGGYVYCVSGDGATGGPTDRVYYAQLTGNGVGGWSETTAYPQATISGSLTNITSPECAAGGGYLYCVGGVSSSSQAVSSAFYAPVSASGVGQWQATTAYPVGVSGTNCFYSSGYIYCVGGQTNAPGPGVYFATAAASGIGAWSTGPTYPASIQGAAGGEDAAISCAAAPSDVYCVGGVSQLYTTIDSVYHATMSGSGFGAWQQTTAFPASVYKNSCVVADGFLVCVGGYSLGYNSGSYSPQYISQTYFAPLSGSGAGAWEQSGDYPVTGPFAPSCVESSGYVYCVGGVSNTSGPTDSVYYTSDGSVTTGTPATYTTSTSPYYSSTYPYYTTTTNYGQGSCLEGFDFSPGGAFGDYAYAGSLCTGQIFRVSPNGTATQWATGFGSVADIVFVQCYAGQVDMYFVNAAQGELEEIAPGTSGGSGAGLPSGFESYVNATGLNYPKGITVAQSSSSFGGCTVYVAESGSGYILRVQHSTVQQFANVGSGRFPVGMAFSSGAWGDYLYVGLAYTSGSEYGIVRVSPNGTVENFALQGKGVAPVGFAPSGYTSGLYAGEYAPGNIWRVDPTGAATEFMVGQGVQTRYMEFAPVSFGGQLVFTDFSSGNLDTVSPQGVSTVLAQTAGSPTTTTTSPPTTTTFPPTTTVPSPPVTTTTSTNPGIPELPFSTLGVLVLTFVVAAGYLAARKKRTAAPWTPG